MINQLLCFSYLGELADTIITITIIIAVVACIAIMCKYEGSRKLLFYVLGCIVIFIGIMSTVGLVKELKAESYVNGSISIPTNNVDVLNYSATNMTLYDDPSDTAKVYSYTTKMDSTEFDGTKYDYRVTLNEYTILDTTIGAGYIYASVPLAFYDVQGNLACEALLNISMHFLSNETQITFAVVGEEQAQYIEQYVNDNGIRLKITEVKK